MSAYLDFCGFHKYVKRRKSGTPHSYSDDSVVKIRREAGRHSFVERFDEIGNLVAQHVGYDSDELEDFKASVLSEALINVTEHGINYRDIGWYTLSQVHRASGIVSINIADNGIGIANSLKTGPQKVSLPGDLDHLYIQEAFKPSVSGAFQASTKRRNFIRKDFEKGQRRGNGLMNIQAACARLGIQFSLISARGYVQYDLHGNCVAAKSAMYPMFAGTLYSFVIPLRKEAK